MGENGDASFENENPSALMLVHCPRKRCAAKDSMRYIFQRREPNDSQDQIQQDMVGCNVCGSTYCERCLHRYSSDGAHPKQCDDRYLTHLCQRYMIGCPRLDVTRYGPWLREYAAIRNQQSDFAKMFQQRDLIRARDCPDCQFGLARWCARNRVQCQQCGATFCYDCGRPSCGKQNVAI